MKPPFSRLAVLGLGMLGGSVAAASRERGLADCVVGAARRIEPLEWARTAGIVDEIGSVEEAVRGADLVVLATPVSAMAATLELAAPALAAGAIVTDVGSVKAHLVDTLPTRLPAGVHFVGSHPMAGSDETGVEHARSDLFVGACCVVTPGPGSDPEIVDCVSRFWEALGARVEVRDPVAHDAEVAWISHLPHLLAFAYGRALDRAPDSAGALAGSGFRDFVRIARSDSELWSDILRLNREALVRPLEAFGGALTALSEALDRGDRDELEKIFASAAETLEVLAPRRRDGQTPAPREPHALGAPVPANEQCSARSGGENPEIQAAPTSGGHQEQRSNS